MKLEMDFYSEIYMQMAHQYFFFVYIFILDEEYILNLLYLKKPEILEFYYY